MRLFTTLLIYLLCMVSLYGQSVIEDIKQIIALGEAITRNTDPDGRSATLDLLHATLAVYITAPDTSAVRNYKDGKTLLDALSDNQPLRTYLVNSGLYELLKANELPTGYSLERVAATRRMKMISAVEPLELFTESGRFDFLAARQSAQINSPELENISQAAGAAKAASGGGDYVSQAILGLAEFIAERAQEELNYTFLVRLRQGLDTNNLKFLFPNTVGFLPELNLLSYKSILPSIRQAFAKDLNQLSFNLGNYLGAYGERGFDSPSVANILLVYQMLELGVRDVKISQILGFTVNRLAANRTATLQKINDALSIPSPEFLNYRKQVALHLDSLETRLLKLNNEINTAIDSAGNIGIRLMSSLNGRSGNDPLRLMFKKLDSGETLNELDTPWLSRWDTSDNKKPLTVLGAWTKGEEPYSYYAAQPDLATYDRLFNADYTLNSEQLVAAGLNGVRELIRFRSGHADYLQRKSEIKRIMEEMNAIAKMVEAERRALSPSALMDTLIKRIELEKVFVSNIGFDSVPYLILENMAIDKSGRSNPDTIRKYQPEIEKRFLSRVNQDNFTGSPELSRDAAAGASTTVYDFSTLDDAYQRVNNSFDAIERTLENATKSAAPDLDRSLQNIDTYASIFGVARELFFLLQKTESAELETEEYACAQDLAPTLLNAEESLLLRGLTYQRLKSVPDLGQISPQMLGSLVLDFSGLIRELNDTSLLINNSLTPEVRGRIKMVHFITSAIRTVLEAPILKRPGSNELQSMTQTMSAFSSVPAISKEFDELYTLTQTGKYRYAVTNLINLVKLFSPALVIESKALDRKSKRRDAKLLPMLDTLRLNGKDTSSIVKRISRLEVSISNIRKQDSLKTPADFFTYATFMADIASADNSESFAAALRSVALPAGSSRIKRQRYTSFEVGALAGVSLGYEKLILPLDLSDADFATNYFVASVFMPVGLGFSSKLRGRNRPLGNKQSTFTFFTSILDLGAIAALRFGESDNAVATLPEFRLSNILAPGAHLLWQLPESPFALGIGIQNGPNVRKFDIGNGGELRDGRAYRFMASFAIDVPIFRFGGR